MADRAKDGLEAFDLLSRNSYDAVVLDVNMPRMNGLQLLQELRKYKIPARVMMASTDTKEGARTTLDALELGALDFVHKPDSAVDCRGENFRREFLRTLNVVANSKLPVFAEEAKLTEEKGTVKEMLKIINHHNIAIYLISGSIPSVSKPLISSNFFPRRSSKATVVFPNPHGAPKYKMRP